MPSHWTYQEFSAASDLEQGDFLVPTEQLRGALAEAHRHFCDEKYLGFLVVTQSCDLVRRRGTSPKTQYVTIAAVRPMRTLAPRLLSAACDPWGHGVLPESRRTEGRQLLERIFNQNEQALGVFYLHPDLDLALGEESLALLRVTVALRSEHYLALTGARKGRLATAFQAKLGWLVANLYGRAASPDWADQTGGDKALKALISKYLDKLEENTEAFWAEDAAMLAAKRAGHFTQKLTPAELRQRLAELHPPKPEMQIADEVVRILQKMSTSPSTPFKLDEEVLRSFRNRLLNSRIRDLIRKPVI